MLGSDAAAGYPMNDVDFTVNGIPLKEKSRPQVPYAGMGTMLSQPFVDVFRKSRSPTPLELVQECLDTVYSCVCLNAELVASTPLRLYVRTKPRQAKGYLSRRGDTRPVSKRKMAFLAKSPVVGSLVRDSVEIEEVSTHPILDLLNRPVDTIEENGVGMTGFTLIDIIVRYCDTVGRTYLYVEKDGPGGNPSSMWVMAPQYMQEYAYPGGDKIIEKYIFSAASAQMQYDPSEIVPFRYPNLATGGYTDGFAPLRAIFEINYMFRLYAAQVNSLLKNAGRPDAVWSPKSADPNGGGSSLDKDSAERLRTKFRQMFSQAYTGGVMVTEDPGSLQMLTWPNKDLIPHEIFAEYKTKIANAYGVPTSKLDRNQANLSGAQTGDYAHARDAGVPRCRRIEAALNQFFIPMYGREVADRLFLSFDSPLPDNYDAQREDDKLLISVGGIYVDELRERQGMAPMADGMGKKIRLPSGMTILDKDGDETNGPAAAPAAPPAPAAQDTPSAGKTEKMIGELALAVKELTGVVHQIATVVPPPQPFAFSFAGLNPVSQTTTVAAPEQTVTKSAALASFGLIGPDGHAHGLPSGKPVTELFDSVFATQRRAVEDREKKENEEAALLLLLSLAWTDAEKAKLLELLDGYAGRGVDYAATHIGAGDGAQSAATAIVEQKLREFLATLIGGVDATTAKRLADAFANPVGETSPVAQAFETAPQRAIDIGDNESSRAFHAGIDAVGKVTGLIRSKRLITQVGACEVCIALEALGEIPFDQSFAHESYGNFEDVPIHDRCRCSVAYTFVKIQDAPKE